MSRTGVDSLDRSIEKTNAWLADVASSFGTDDRRLAYRVTRSWLHILRDRLPVPVAAHVAAQLPELLRGVFYEGWNPSKVPIKFGREEYVARFARDAQIHHSEVPVAGRNVTSAMRKHMSPGAINEALGVLPSDIKDLITPQDGAGARAEAATTEPQDQPPAQDPAQPAAKHEAPAGSRSAVGGTP